MNTHLNSVRGITEHFPTITTRLPSLSRIAVLEQRMHKIQQMPEGKKKAYWLRQLRKEMKIIQHATAVL